MRRFRLSRKPWLLLAAAGALLGFARPAAADFGPAPVFTALTVAPLNTGPNGITVGDLDNDGTPDLVISVQGANVIYVLIGNGDGTFTPKPANGITVGTGPVGVAIGDLNSDGHPDIVVANPGTAPSGDLSILIQATPFDGTAWTQTSLTAGLGSNPVSVAIANIDAGTVPDLVVANIGSANVSVLLGNGSGGFTAMTGSPFGVGTAPLGLAVGDLGSKDGHNDIVVTNFNNQSPTTANVSVLLGTGTGFAGHVDYTTGNPAGGSGAESVALADLNGDGILDAVVSNENNNNVSVLLGNANGTFQTATNTDAGTGVFAAGVAVGDFNVDGKLDVVVADAVGTTAVLFNGDGTGALQRQTTALTAGSTPFTAGVGDFNGDGKPDIAVTNFGSANFSVFMNNLTLSADLGVSKGGPASVVAGQNVVYTITVTNNGPNTAFGVSVADPTPAGLTFASNTGDCTTVFPCALGTLGVGKSKTITSTFTVPPGYAGPSPFVNTATVSSTTPDPGPTANTSNASTTVNFQANVGITKTGPASVLAGQNVAYTITVTNAGPSNAAAVQVSDPAPAGLTFVSNSGACTGNPCVIGTMAPNAPATITWTFTVPANYSGANPFTNTATVVSTTTDPTPANNTASVQTTVTFQADMSLTKTGPANVTAGTNVVYTITVTNNGPNTATGVSVADATPAGLGFVSNAGACTGTFPCSLGTMTNGQVATITSTFSVPSGYSGANPIQNTATVSVTGVGMSDPVSGNNSQTASTPVVFSADVGITKTGPASVTAGSNAVYTITVTNNGPSNAAAVQVTDPAPAGLTFVSNSGACTGNPCVIGTMTKNQVSTITWTFAVPSGYSGANPIQNTANVTTTTADPTPGNNQVTTPTPVVFQADVGVTNTGPANVTAGQNVVYTIVVRNNGPSDASLVSVADAPPAGLTFVSNTGACVGGFPCSLGTMTNGQVVTITSTFHVASSFSGPIQYPVTISSSTTDPTPGNNSATASTPVILSADVAITKTGPAGAARGANVVYTITVTNNGPSDAASVQVADVTPAGLGFVSNAGACTQPFPCPLGTLTSGQTATITSTFSIPAGYSGANPILNTATVNSATSDPTGGNNSSTASTPVTSLADLTVTKTGPAFGTRGGTAVYTIVVTNAGPSSANAVQVDDNLAPVDVTFASNAGDCTTAFPCLLGTLAPGASKTITSTFNIPVGHDVEAPIVNTATVSSTTTDPDTSNDTSTATTKFGAFYTVNPCRLVDTRPSSQLGSGEERPFDLVALAAASCGGAIPTGAQAVSVNLTVTGATAPGNVRLYPADASTVPTVSSINFVAGQTRANNAIVATSADGLGKIKVKNSSAGTVHFILDVNGYFQ